MITRRALLISAPGQLCAGANADLQTARNFLLSPRGGAWTEDEITVLENPAMEKLLETVAGQHADYTITYFFGGAFSDPAGKRFLVLNGGDFVQDTELLNSCEKQLVLVDGCPETIAQEVLQFDARADEIQLARRMYDKWIERCEAGQMIMHACEPGRKRKGRAGLFTRKLLQLASMLPSIENRFNLKSILAAGHEVPSLLLQEGEDEAPDISYMNGNGKLPFALALPLAKKSKDKNTGFDGLTLGILLLGLLFSGE